ncbi:SMI1/KNR4 family protein [Actinoplanes sp. L3-i22]|uniref:SMI1/KNR4 family protein n=1 Tax=Actinoplanes sp. L3-i22 TaxID=2836373 RepID=UPI001C84ED3C|nr:SMI1/KNR4 family protein [Actinoplanes sp. L3-i22]
MSERIAGARYAFRAAFPASPMLRVRYRHGVPVDPWGFPDWTPYARILVALPPAIADLSVEEARVVDVRAADRVARGSGDPLWTGTVGTPVGWTWAHAAQTRHLALVPAELHASFRHLGGVSVGARSLAGHGLTAPAGEPPGILVADRLTEAAQDAADERFGVRLPPHYRDFLGRTNGGAPSVPAVHPGHGFVLDQPLFGFREDRSQDLGYLNAFFGDRLTGDWLAIGLVQGGLLALRVRGEGAGTVGYLDDDDPRDRDHFTADDVCARLMHRLAGDFGSFWLALRAVPSDLEDLAESAAARAEPVEPDGLGTLLPGSHRRTS